MSTKELCMMPVRLAVIDKLTGAAIDWMKHARNKNIDGIMFCFNNTVFIMNVYLYRYEYVTCNA